MNISEKGKQAFYTLAISIFIAVLWNGFASTYLIGIPNDFYSNLRIISVDNFYDEERESFRGEQFSVTGLTYETVSAVDNVSIIKNIFSVKTTYGEPIIDIERLYGIDRKTGAHVPGFGDRDRNGYLFAPQNLKKGEAFTYWHVNYDGPANMEFVDVEYLDDLEVYKYKTDYEGVNIDQTKNLGYLPEVGKTRGVRLYPELQLWVEPSTGRIVKYQDEATAYFYDLKTGEDLTPWNKFSNTVDERSLEENVIAARIAKNKKSLLLFFVPIFILLIGLAVSFWRINLLVYLKKHIKLLLIEKATGWSIVIVGSSVILGWMFDLDLLIRVMPFGSGMNPLIAILFMLVGACILLRGTTREYLLQPLSIALVAVSLLELGANFDLYGFDPDLILWRELILSKSYPSFMGLFDTTNFLFFGMATLLYTKNSLIRIELSKIALGSIVILSALSLVRFFFSFLEITISPFFFYSAVHTTLLFFIGGLVTLTAYIAKESYIKSLKNNIFVLFAVLLPLLSIFFLSVTVEKNIINTARNEFTDRNNLLVKNIEDRLSIYINTLEGARGLFSASQNVNRDEWRAYIESLNIEENYPGVQALGYGVLVSPEKKQKHIEEVRNQGFREYTIRPDGERDLYSSIIYIEPFDERNSQAFGFDMFQEPTRRLAMEQARDNNRPFMSGKVTLVQEIDEDVQPGFLIYVPVYENGSRVDTIRQRQDSIVGYVYVAFRSRDLIDDVLGGVDNIHLKITDGIKFSTENELYDSIGADYSQLSRDISFTDKRIVYVAGRPWRFELISDRRDNIDLIDRYLPISILFSGVILSILIAIIIYGIVTSRQKAIDYANEVTEDLRKSSDDLRKFKLATDSTSDAVIITNKNAKVLYANKAAVTMTGHSLKDIVGKKCGESWGGQMNKKFYQNLWETILSKKSWTGEVINKHKNGQDFIASTSISPILDEQGEIIFFVETMKDITRQKQEQQELEKYKVALDGTSDHVIITDSNGIIIYANDAVERITGFTREEVLGKKAGAKDLWGGLMDKEFYGKLWKTIGVDKKPFVGEIKNKRKDGVEYFALSSISPILNDKGDVNFFVGIERDISKDIESEKNKEQSEAFFNLAVDMMCLAGTDGYFTRVNGAFLKILGWSEKELLSKSFLEFIHPDDRSSTLEEVKKLGKGQETINFKNRYQKKDGDYVTLSWSAHPSKDGTLFALAHDVSEEERINKSKSEFVSIASHQLRTPLTGIHWVVERLMKKYKFSKQVNEYLFDIHQSAERLAKLVDLLLNVSRIEEGRVGISPQSIDLVEFIDSYLVECRPLLDKKKQTIAFKEHPKKALMNSDTSVLRNIVQSLVSNAIEYTPDGGKIEISLEAKPKTIILKVADTGIGIPKEEQGKLFGKFYRATNAQAVKTDGTGLGLYIAKQASELLGGSLAFESPTGKRKEKGKIVEFGTTFTVELPIKVKEKTGDRQLA